MENSTLNKTNQLKKIIFMMQKNKIKEKSPDSLQKLSTSEINSNISFFATSSSQPPPEAHMLPMPPDDFFM